MKNWFQSKTIWVAIISIVIGLLTWVQGELILGQAITVQGLLMVALRLMTNQSIGKTE